MSRGGVRWDDAAALEAMREASRTARRDGKGSTPTFIRPTPMPASVGVQWERFQGGARRHCPGGRRSCTPPTAPRRFGDRRTPPIWSVRASSSTVEGRRRYHRGRWRRFGLGWWRVRTVERGRDGELRCRHGVRPRTTTIATLGGIRRRLSSRDPRAPGTEGRPPRVVELAGRDGPVVGRVTMDLTMVAVEAPVAVGDVATVYGGIVSLDQQAAAAGTISYEMLTGLGGRLPRRYHPMKPRTKMTRRAAIIVLDGLGIGQAHDSRRLWRRRAATRSATSRAPWADFDLPNLAGARSRQLRTASPACRRPRRPRAAQGICEPASAGKDSTPGTGRSADSCSATPFPTYPSGFPEEVIAEFSRRTGRGVIGNRAASGTAGARRARRGAPAHGQVDRLHLGRQRVPGGGARGDRAARGAVRRVRVGASDAPGGARRFAGHRAAVLRRAGCMGPHRRSARISVCRPRRRRCSTGSPSIMCRASAWARWTTCSTGRGISSIHTATNGEAYGLIEGALGRCVAASCWPT